MLRRWMTPAEPPPPEELRPWYYQRYFLAPIFIFSWPLLPALFILWPAWAVLIIRSPWHNSVILGALAWANLFSGGYVAARQVMEPGLAGPQTLAYIVPGLILTLATQIHWFRHRQKIAAWRQAQTTSPRQASHSESAAPEATPRLRRRRSRRPNRHRGAHQ